MIRCGWVLTDLAGGGAERIPLLLAPAFRATELRVILLKDLIEHEVGVGDPTIVRLSSGKHSLGRAWAPILTRMVRTARSVDVLIAGLEWAPTFFAVAGGTLATKPVVATVHTDLHRYREIEPIPRGWWSAMRRALRRCAAVVAVSESVRESVVDLGVEHRRVHVIPNPVKPFDGRRPVARGGPIRILTVASLKAIKGVDLVLDTARLLDHLDFEWTVVGDGPERETLCARTKELGLTDRVQFVGFRPDPNPFYGDADLYVLPSRMEGAPLALAEAMSAGLPVVATRCGLGVEELVDSSVGELVANENTEALATAIRDLATDPVRRARLGGRARERAKSYEPSIAARRYENLLSAVVSEHSTKRRH